MTYFTQLILYFQKTNDKHMNASLSIDKEEFAEFKNMSKDEVYKMAFESGVISACKRLQRETTIKLVLEYFDNQYQRIIEAADYAITDNLLFEKFEMWTQERDDEVFLFHIERFFEKKDLQPLSASERDLTKRHTNFFKSAKKVMPKKAFKKAVKRGKRKAKNLMNRAKLQQPVHSAKTLLGQALIDGLSDAIMSERAFKAEEDETDDFY